MGYLSENQTGPTRLKTDGCPPYMLPEVLSHGLLESLLQSQPEDELFIGALSLNWPLTEKNRFIDACRSFKDLWPLCCKHMVQWAGMVNGDNKWSLSSYNIVYDTLLPNLPCLPDGSGGNISSIYITTFDMRFVQISDRVLTFSEYRWLYKESITSYMVRLKRLAVEHLNRIQNIMESALCPKKLTVCNFNEVYTGFFVGLDAIPVSAWRLPNNFSFLEEVNCTN